MRVMMLWKPVKENDTPPTQEHMAAMGALIENMAKSALERKIFDDYVVRADDQRREDRLAVVSQFAEIKVHQSVILDKIDKIVAILLQANQGRRSGDDRV